MGATSITFEASVGLNNKFPGFLAQQNCVPEGEEALWRSISDGCIPLIQGPPCNHIPCGLQHLQGGGVKHLEWALTLHPQDSARDHSQLGLALDRMCYETICLL